MEPLPRYILHQALGSGGMGVVHLGTLISPAGRRRVAIKQLVARGGIDEAGRARLVAEARLVFRLTHTNICQVIDLGENERGTFVVMELVPGLDLRALLAELKVQGRRLDVASAVYIARDIARALDYAHRRSDDQGVNLGLVHGDVTPQNILLSVEGEVKLTDFGIAHALGMAAPGTGLVGGTRGYMAPERADGFGDHRADIFALGVTMLAALTGESGAVALERLGQLPALRLDVTPQLFAIIRRAVAPMPTARFLSAAELERDLSLELARRYPAFTPSILARVVRQCRQRSGVEEPVGDASDTLTSLTGGDTRPPEVEARAEVQTETVAPARRMRWPFVAAGALVAMAFVVVSVVRAISAEDAHAPLPVAANANPAPFPNPSPEPNPIPNSNPNPIPIPIPNPPPNPPLNPPPNPPPNPIPERKPPATAAASHPARRHRPTAAPPAADGYLTINATPWGSVVLDGRTFADETPVYRRAIPAGDHVVLIRFADGGVSQPKRVHVAAGETRTLGFER